MTAATIALLCLGAVFGCISMTLLISSGRDAALARADEAVLDALTYVVATHPEAREAAVQAWHHHTTKGDQS